MEEDEKKNDGKLVLNEMFNVSSFSSEDLITRYTKYLNKVLQKNWDPHI